MDEGNSITNNGIRKYERSIYIPNYHSIIHSFVHVIFLLEFAPVALFKNKVVTKPKTQLLPIVDGEYGKSSDWHNKVDSNIGCDNRQCTTDK